MSRKARFGAGLVVLVVGLATLVIFPANSVLFANPAPAFPTPVVVGQTFPAGLGFNNNSSGQEAADYPVLTFENIVLVPSCDNFNAYCSGGVETGVFDLSATGVGTGTATNCNGTWTITETTPGSFTFTPPGGDLMLAVGDTCNVTYTVTTLRVPTNDTSNTTFGVQTNQIATALITAPGNPNGNPAIPPLAVLNSGPDVTTVNPAVPALTTLATVGLPTGPGSLGTFSDTAFLQSPPPPSSTNGAPPTGTITFTLYGPFPTAPTAGSCTAAAIVPPPQVVAVNGFRDPPNGYDTPTPVNITTPGFYTWVATYSGDPFPNPNYLPSSSICGDADETAEFLPAPTITLVKTATPLTMPEPGGTFTFDVLVTNTSPEPVTITSLQDDVYGDLNGQGTCATGATLAASGGTYTCSFPGVFTGSAPAAQTDTVTAIATDDRGLTATAFDDATVSLTDVLPTIVVDKTANPLTLPEPGGNFVFTVVVTNTSAESVTVQSLVDDIYGNLDDPANPNVTANGCLNVVGTVLAPSNAGTTDTVTCTFTGAFTGVAPATQTDIVTATATDIQGNIATDSDDATVTLTDVLPTITVDKTGVPLILPEPGGNFTFTVVVTNTSNEPVTIQTLTDNIYGNLNDAANPLVTANSCVGAVGTQLAAANAGTTDTFTCSFTGMFTGAAPATQTDVVTSTATDDDGNTATDLDDATVGIGDVLPSITVDKTADPLTLPEPGGNFNFTVVVTNTSAETVTIRDLTDNIYGDLDDPANPLVTANGCAGAVGTQLAAANAGTTDTFTCTFTGAFTGVGGAAQTDIVSSTVDDTQGNTATDTDDATVTITPLPTIVVDKTANPLTLPEPGGDFTFTVVVTNSGTVPVTIQSLVDDVYGNLDDAANPAVSNNGCLAAVGTPLAAANPGTTDSFTCTFVGAFAGAAGASETDTVLATAVDADGNVASDDDPATVSITGLAPVITVDKTANPLTLPEPGGAFSFTVVVTNTSTVEAVTITSLVDDIYGNLDDAANPLVTNNTCLDAVGTLLATANAGTTDTFTCSFTGQFTGGAGAAQTDVVTATAVDDDQQSATDSDDATVTITDVLPVITVNKTANPVTLPEPGGTYTFSVNVTNNSSEQVTITDLDDDVYGDIVTLPGSTCGTLIGDVLAPGATSDTCTFTGVFTGVPGASQVDVVTATADDDDGNTATDTDDATVTITNVVPTILVDKTATPPSLPEPGGVFTFNVVVTNVSTEQLTITTLTDDIYGDLTTQGTCTNAIGTVLAAGGGSYSCSFTGNFAGTSGASQTDVVTAVAVDDENTPATDTDDAIVTITGVPPTVTIVKTASPTTLPEPGGNFTFTFVVTNTSVSETVTITSLTDDIYGNLNGRGNCVTGAVLAPAATYTCAFTVPFTGQPGATQTDVASVTVVDDDGEQASDTDDAVITITDIPPVLTVQKTATPLTRNEPGGSFTFDVVITNTSAEVVTITSLTDDIYGNLNGRGTCVVGAVLPANGGTYRCSFTGDFFGNGGATQTDVVTVSGVDNDGSSTTAHDDAIVTIVDVPPTVTVTKDADPVSRPEPGGAFTFVVTIVNTSAEPVTVVSITDDVYGNVVGRGNCVAGAIIQPGGSYRCQFTVDFRGTAGAFQVDRVFVTVVDNEGSKASANDDARISITPLATPPVVQPLAPAPAPPAVTPQQLSRTGSDVAGPARLALALLVAGLLMLGATWRSKRGFGFALAPGGGPATTTSWLTRLPSPGGISRFLGGRAATPPHAPPPVAVIVEPVTDLPADPPVEGPTDDAHPDDTLGPDDISGPDGTDPDDDPGRPGGGGGAPPAGRGPAAGGGSDAATPAVVHGGGADSGGWAAPPPFAPPAPVPPASDPDAARSILDRAEAIAPAARRVTGAEPSYPAEVVGRAQEAPSSAAPAGEGRFRAADARRIAGITRLVTMVLLVAGVTHATGSGRRNRSAGRRSV